MYIKPTGDEIGARLRIARKNAGLTLKQTGNLSGVTGQAVSQWESGDTKNLGAVNAYLTAEGLNVSLGWLLFGIGDQAPLEIREPEVLYSSNKDIIDEINRFGIESPEKLDGLRLFLGLPGKLHQEPPTSKSSKIAKYHASFGEIAGDTDDQTNITTVNIDQEAAKTDESKDKNDSA